MRQGPNGRRPRGRHHGGGNDRSNGGGGGGGGGNQIMGNRPRSAASLRHQSFDSNCGDLRVRGNAWQVYEKYQALARDATSGGDRIAAENYLQHAEHYFRIIEAIDEATAAEQRLHGDQPNAPFGQQPEIPANYYTQGSVASPACDSNGNASQQTSAAPQSQAEATVQTRNPPPQSSPFFTQEEIDEQNGDQPLSSIVR
jgi:hypothetical protein